MEAKELRIGNLVDLYGSIATIQMVDFDESKKTGIAIDQGKPIELTEDWLLKFGLKRMPESEYTLDSYDFAGFKLWMNEGKFLFNDKINIEFVHQLQNLYFALTEEELTIKPTKPEQ